MPQPLKLRQLRDTVLQLQQDILKLKDISADVDYKELGIDDGSSIREEDTLDNGELMKAEIHPGEGEESPTEGSMVYVHIVVHGKDEDTVILSSRKEHGGSGRPYIYLVTSGKSRPLRGVELALLGMKKKERCIVLLKPGMGLMHKDIGLSSMGQLLTELKVPKTEDLKIDLELLGWSTDNVTPHSCSDKGEAIKIILKSGIGWENPRVPFDVRLKLEVRLLDSDGRAIKGDLVYPQLGDEMSVNCGLGEGFLPNILESAISSMRKEEECLIICPANCCQCLLLSDDLLATVVESEFLEFFVKLEDFSQVRDLLGDGKTYKRIVRKGVGEFPIDCPLEDTRVSIRSKVRTSGKEWLPLLTGSDTEKTSQFNLGMAELPERVEAAIHVMLPGEISILQTKFEGDLIEYLSKDARFECDENIEIELELVDFEPIKHLDSLQPDEKLSRATLNKEQGNKLFKMNKIRNAKAKYQKALKCVGKSYEFEGAEQEAGDIKIACMLNLAACAQKETTYGEAIDWCNKILEENSKCTKAYFRRAKAKASLGAYEEALHDLNQILSFDPSLELDINREKAILLKKSKDAHLKQKNEFSNFFSRN